MSLVLLFEKPFQIVNGSATGGNAPQTGVAMGSFTPAPEAIVLVLPIQTMVSLMLPIGLTPPVIPQAAA